MDIEDLIKNINNYDEITKLFYENYLKNKNITFDKILKDTLKNKSFKLKLNKIILRKSFLKLVEKNILKLDEEFLKFLIKKPQKVYQDPICININFTISKMDR